MPLELVGAPTSKPSILICLFSYGGLHKDTFVTLQDELAVMRTAGIKHEVLPVHDDALISRSRSKALSVFLEGKHDVCFMLDHDIQWSPGAVLLTAQQAMDRGAMVGGLYPCRGMARGISSRLVNPETRFKAGDNLLLDAEYLATGFLAIPRVVAEETLKYGTTAPTHINPDDTEFNWTNARLSRCFYLDGTSFYDFFRPICVKRSVSKPGLDLAPYEYLSEDWSFCYRAKLANPNRPQLAWTAPWLIHHGSYGYSLLDAAPRR